MSANVVQEPHLEFSEALKRARSARVAVLSAEARRATLAPMVSYRMRILANIAAQDFRDRSEQSVGGIPGAPPIAVKHDDKSAMACYLRAAATAGAAVEMPQPVDQ